MVYTCPTDEEVSGAAWVRRRPVESLKVDAMGRGFDGGDGAWRACGADVVGDFLSVDYDLVVGASVCVCNCFASERWCLLA